MMKVSVQTSSKSKLSTVTLSNNVNTKQYWLKDYNMSDFDWYKCSEDNKYYLAAYVTKHNCKQIANDCHLFHYDVSPDNIFGKRGGMAPIIKGGLCGPMNQWFVVKMDNRNGKRMISANMLDNHLFSLYYHQVNGFRK